MNKETKDEYYFQGKYFGNDEDMFEYIGKWSRLPLDQQTAQRNLRTLEKDIVTNIFMRGVEFDNAGFLAYLDRIFEFAMKDLNSSSDNSNGTT